MLPPGRKPLGAPSQIAGYYTVNYPKVNRVEVIGDDGRAYTNYNATDVQLHIQDDGRTMKVFLRTKKVEL